MPASRECVRLERHARIARKRHDFIAHRVPRYSGAVSLRSRLILLGLAALFAGVILLVWTHSPHSSGEAGALGMRSKPLAALADASGWLNHAPLTADSLRGHTVVIVAWSDTDPLSLRLLREADEWLKAYGRFGLRVVGVHVPEFAFSADSAAPARTLRRLDAHLPVALDAGSRVGSQLGVGEVLPLWVVVGPEGRRDLVAEGDRADAVLKAAIEALRRSPGPSSAELPLPVAPVERTPRATRRIYCGTSRVSGGPLATALPGEARMFTAQFRYQEQGLTYTPYPVGRWKPSADGVTSARGGAADYVAIRYDVGSVDAVLGSPVPSRVWVMCDDGWVPPTERGEDVRTDARGATFVEVSEPRAYALLKGGGAHVLRLTPEAPGVSYYAFLFGAE